MTTIKKTAIALSVIVLFASKSFANPLTDTASAVNYSTSVEEPLTVEYLGEQGDYLLFHVEVKSGTNKNVSFVLKDKNEGEIYSAKYSKDKIQTIKVEKTGNQQLDFNLTIGKESYSKTFTVIPTVTLTTLVSNK